MFGRCLSRSTWNLLCLPKKLVCEIWFVTAAAGNVAVLYAIVGSSVLFVLANALLYDFCALGCESIVVCMFLWGEFKAALYDFGQWNCGRQKLTIKNKWYLGFIDANVLVVVTEDRNYFIAETENGENKLPRLCNVCFFRCINVNIQFLAVNEPEMLSMLA